jgi:hypothetical protein
MFKAKTLRNNVAALCFLASIPLPPSDSLVAVPFQHFQMDRCGFTPEQQDFIWRWVRHEINLVGEVAEEETAEV